MVWFGEGQHRMLTIRRTEGGFDLLQVSEQGSQVVESFEDCDEAIQRWNRLEEAIRRGQLSTS